MKNELKVNTLNIFRYHSLIISETCSIPQNKNNMTKNDITKTKNGISKISQIQETTHKNLKIFQKLK
jgi:hypothetical protein